MKRDAVHGILPQRNLEKKMCRSPFSVTIAALEVSLSRTRIGVKGPDEGEGLAIEGRASGGSRATLAESARNQKLILSYKEEGLPCIWRFPVQTPEFDSDS